MVKDMKERQNRSGRSIKKIVSLFLCFLLLLSFSVAAFGKEAAKSEEDGIKVYIDGSLLETRVPPIIINDRCMVPFRAIFEAFQMNVDYIAQSKTIKAHDDQTSLTLVIGKKEVTVNDLLLVSDTAPVLVKDTTLVPLRFVSEVLKADVLWEAKTKTVTIKKYVAPVVEYPSKDDENGGNPLLGVSPNYYYQGIDQRIVGTSLVSLETAIKWAKSKGAADLFLEAAPLYWKYGKLTGIRPEVLYAQSAKETNFGKYTGVVKAEQNNFAGIKVYGQNGDRQEDHETFATMEDGVRAHFNHMSAYVGLDPIGETHGRYASVVKMPWAGTVTTVLELGAKWAPNSTYGESILLHFLKPMLDMR